MDNVTGGAGNDTLRGDAGTNILIGGAGNDTITGRQGGDTLHGDAGNDTFVYRFDDGADAIDGGADTDVLSIVAFDGADETISVVWDGTRITGVGGGSLTGIETITLDLGNGVDTLDYSASTAAVTVNLAIPSADGFTSIAGVENVTGGSGNDVLTGSTGDNVLDGGAGTDTMCGRRRQRQLLRRQRAATW